MRKLIIIILGLFSVAYGQKYQSMPQAGYGPVKRMQHDSVLTIPMGIERLRNLSDGRDSGQIRYNPSDSSMYVYTGHTWVKCGRSELTALAPLYAYNDTTIAIDTTSSEGVATKWDLSQVSGGTDSSVYATHYYVDSSLNNYGTFNIDRLIDGNGFSMTIDSTYTTNLWSRTTYNSEMSQLILDAGDGVGSQLNYYTDSIGSSLIAAQFSAGVYLSKTSGLNARTNSIALTNSGANTMAAILADSVRIDIPSKGLGKVLTSNELGTATWQTPTGGSNVGDSLVKAYDTLAAHNTRIGALEVGKASLSGATFTSRVQLQGVNISKDSIPIVSNKQWVMFIDTSTGRVSRQLDIDNEPIINAMQALGSTYKSTTVGVDVSKIAAASAINANTVYYMVTWIPNDTTITGVSWYQTVQGVYTASGYNGVGLYSYSGGTWTLVASSTDDGNIWKATANTYPTKDFTTPYRAAKGVYAIALTYNRSAVTTAPTIGRGGVLTNAAASSIGTNSAKLYSSSSGSSLPSSIAASSQSTVNTPYFLALY